jgi:hypothetical protein
MKIFPETIRVYQIGYGVRSSVIYLETVTFLFVFRKDDVLP